MTSFLKKIIWVLINPDSQVILIHIFDSLATTANFLKPYSPQALDIAATYVQDLEDI